MQSYQQRDVRRPEGMFAAAIVFVLSLGLFASVLGVLFVKLVQSIF